MVVHHNVIFLKQVFLLVKAWTQLIDTILQPVYKDLQYGGRQKSAALFAKDLEISQRHCLKINKCRHFEANQDIRKSPWQICSKFLKSLSSSLIQRKMIQNFTPTLLQLGALHVFLQETFHKKLVLRWPKS